jgi:iron complex outermembrane recepter protein
MTMRYKPLTASTAIMLAAWLFCSSALAVEPDAQSTPSSPGSTEQAGTLETITVTAQRQEQNLQDVPISVTAFTSSELATEQITSTVDLQDYVPNMFAANNVGQASANVYYLRGLGQTQSFPTFEPQVGTYVDDIYIARQNANNFALFGVQSVQVLNGPQGTLFGRNSTGGAIVVTLQQPSHTFGGDAEMSYGQIGDGLSDFYTAKAAVDIPISQGLLTRTAFYGITDNGYVDDLTTNQRLNGRNNWGVREALRILPSSRAHWNVSFDYERNNAANLLNQPGPDGNRISYSGFSVVGGALLPYLTGVKATFGQGVIVTSYGVASNLSFDIGSGTLDFITGYRGLHQELAADFAATVLGNLPVADAVPTGEITLAQDLKNHQVSQEVKWHDVVGALNYTSGVYFLYEENGNDYGQVLGLGPTLAFPLNDQYDRNDTTSIAAYGQGDYKITSALTFTLGGRFTNETKDVTAHPDAAGLGYDTAQIQAVGYATHLETNQFTPRIALDYRFDPNLMVFASATRGFQGGGWNGLTGTNPEDFNPFRPETIWSYETGWRSTPTNRLRFNTTFFYEDVKDDQLLYDNPHTDSFDTSNGASMYGYGAEAQIEWRPIDALTLDANISSMKAGFYDPSPLILAQEAGCRAGVAVDCEAGIVKSNGALATPVYTPSLDATVSGSYVLHFGSLTVTPFLAVHFVGSEWFDTANTPGPAAPYPGVGGMDPARTLLDASVTFAEPSRLPLTVTAECRNCTMVNYGTADLLGLDYYNTPGEWDIRLNYAF